jgi:hypothetical protein
MQLWAQQWVQLELPESPQLLQAQFSHQQFPSSLPAAGGWRLDGGATQQKENQARENILTDCLDKRGYRAFSGLE